MSPLPLYRRDGDELPDNGRTFCRLLSDADAPQRITVDVLGVAIVLERVGRERMGVKPVYASQAAGYATSPQAWNRAAK